MRQIEGARGVAWQWAKSVDRRFIGKAADKLSEVLVTDCTGVVRKDLRLRHAVVFVGAGLQPPCSRHPAGGYLAYAIRTGRRRARFGVK
ncbi:MAG: hypothetical protein RXR20_01770 [Paraburkholderia sp.]|jgi:hypothetical protein|uniref:hypothetical protein n=1 Tax=Burkholderiaceae TaxID=119060 RepID=UPI0014853AED|nr:hypothetical protein [Burkholderia sp. 4M9327F10]